MRRVVGMGNRWDGNPHSCGVYALTDPRDGAVRYIGKSVDIPARYAAHLQDHGSNGKHHWLAELKGHGLEPGVRVLDLGSPREIPYMERRWMRYGRAAGWALANDDWQGMGENGGDVGRAIYAIRESLSICQGTLARRIGVEWVDVNRWENGHAIPSPHNLAQLVLLSQEYGYELLLALAGPRKERHDADEHAAD